MCVPARKVRWIRLHTDDTRTAEPMLPAVSLHILGNFELIVGEQHASALEDHPSRLRSLLCYLVLHRDRAVTHDELIENFYSDETQRDPVGALKMQILRLRALLRPLMGEDVSPIRSHRGSYQWDASLPCEVDAEHFEMLCFAAEEPQRSDSERRELYREAMALYRGNVHLEKNEPLWNRTLGTCYFTRYLTAAQKCAALLIDGGEYAEAEALSLRAIAMDPLNESLYAAAIRAMLRQKKYAEARRQYLALADLLHRELGVRPSEELQQLYAQCAKEERSGTQDLGTVMSILGAEEAAQRGAFYCSFDQFKSVYQLELRRMQRSGECMHVLMLTVSGAGGKPLSAKTAYTLMPMVQQSLLESLRQSDVVAQFSASQFIVLLPCANYENSMMVSRRIMDSYRNANPRSAAQLSCQIREPGSL